MRLSTGAICGACLVAFGLVLPAWALFFAAELRACGACNGGTGAP